MTNFRVLHIISGNFCDIKIKRKVSIEHIKIEFEILMLNYLTTPLTNSDSEYNKRQKCINLIEEKLNPQEPCELDWCETLCQFILYYIIDYNATSKSWENLMLSEFEIVEIV